MRPSNEAGPPLRHRRLISPAQELSIEARLAACGILPLLEALNVVPVVINPNPYHFETDFVAHEIWWRRRPEVVKAYCEALDQRRAALARIDEALTRAYSSY